MNSMLEVLLTGQNRTGAWRYDTSSNDFDNSCTQFAALGLAVAAPSLVAHNYFQRKIETMAVSMEGLVADLLAKCYPEHR